MPRRSMYGDWRILDQIGSGGNGYVYRCTGTDGTEAAIKVLKRDRNRRDRIVRFRNEVGFLISHGRRPGILPLLDHALPNDPAEDSWYVMPVAVPLAKALDSTPGLPRVVEVIEHIARTLADLVAEGVSHRDIKPENLFRLGSEWVIGDFGLVQYPEQEAATRSGQPLGPRYFMAPEMRRNADAADAELADVYSLAKTLWAIATGCADPPVGQLRRDTPRLQLSSHVEDQRARLLEPLLEWCTADDPVERPRLEETAEELAWWIEPTVSVKSDLSGYAKDVRRLRDITSAVKKDTNRERLERLYDEAFGRVSSSLTKHLLAAMKECDLRQLSSPEPPNGWLPEGYGGGSALIYWGVETTLSSPWLAASIGVVHPGPPNEDLEDLAVMVLLAMMTPDSQHDYIREIRRFRPGSLQLDQIIRELKEQFERELPDVISHYLNNCAQQGIPTPGPPPTEP